jgi:hypothetical protein
MSVSHHSVHGGPGAAWRRDAGRVRSSWVAQPRAEAGLGPAAREGGSRMGIADRPGPPCDEDTFHYLLSVERKRSRRSGRTFHLLLVDLKEDRTLGTHIDAEVALKLFLGLGRGLRGTDLVGWYRTERVIGAVLAECKMESAEEALGLVRQRLEAIFSDSLPAGLTRRLRMRIRHQALARRDGVSTRSTAQELT